MKTFFVAFLLCFALRGYSQKQADPQGVAVAPNTNLFVALRGPNSRVWATITTHTNQAGKLFVQTNSAYTEVGTGLCYEDGDGVLQDAVEQIDIVADGASATHSQHKVHWMSNANFPGGAVTLTTPDNLQFVSQVEGLCYVDAVTHASVLISQLQDCQGQVVGNNRVVYPNAFNGVQADIEYVYSIDGLEQNIVLREQPPPPEAYGMSSQTSHLEVFTEFFNPPVPRIVTLVEDGLAYDDFLDFGNMSIGPGAAFLIPGQGDPHSAGPVFKHWAQINGQQYLFEELPYATIANLVQALPLHAGIVKPGENLFEHLASKNPKSARPGDAKPVGMRAVQASPRTPGLVVDYTVVSSAANYTFQGDTTYYLSANVTMSGTNTTFEGGTVLKYASNVTMTVNSPVTWTASAYNPVIMTAKNDGGVGGPISGGNPGTTYYAKTALYFNASTAGTNLVLNHLRVMNAQTAVAIYGSTNHVLSDVQMVNCGNGLAATNTSFSLWNGLMTNVMTNFTGINSTGDVEQLTVDTSDYLNSGETLGLTNCLLYNVTNATGFTSNKVYSPSGSGIFQSAGLGAHYLPTGSQYLNAGTTNINPSLAAALPQLTTFAPVVVTTNITGNTTLFPQAQRDTGTPDIGYHYDPLDYLLSNLTVNSGVTLTLTNGVAVGLLGHAGLTVNGNLVSQGTPLTLNQMAPATVAQEGFAGTNLNSLLGGYAQWQSLYLRFTGLPMPGGSDANTYGMYFQMLASGSPGQVIMQDCQLAGGCIYLALYGGGSMTMTLFNNLFCRTHLIFVVGDPGSLLLNYGNNLLHLGTVLFVYAVFSSPGASWEIFNNLFENSSVTENIGTNWHACVRNGNNAYINSTELVAPSGVDLFPTTADYQAGALGSYYYPTNGGHLSTLIHAGNVLASGAGSYYSPPATGLALYTVTTNNVIEGTNTVSIGFHYIAVGSNGLPLPFTNLFIVTQPVSQIVFAGQTVTNSVTAGGNQPFFYQWQHDGTNLAGAASSVIILTNVQTAEAGSYSVNVTNYGTNVTSAIATLTVLTNCGAPPGFYFFSGMDG